MKINRILVDVGQNLLRNLPESNFRVTHRGWRIAVYGTKVTLAVHQRIAQRPILGHADHGVVHRGVPVRVVLTQYFPHYPRRFLVRTSGGVSHLVHSKQYPTVHRLKAVSHIRQRPGNNHRHRIIDVGGFHFLLDVDFNDFFAFVRIHSIP